MPAAARTSAAPLSAGEPAFPTDGVRLEPSSTRFARGPMRPGALTPVRSRLTGAMIGRSLRLLDACMLAAATGACILSHPALAVDILALAASVFTFGLLPTLGAYLYEPEERIAPAVVRVGGAVLGGFLVLAALRFAAPETRSLLWPWTAVAFAGLGSTHAGALACVRRWRDEGRLTPNILVVGATENARQLIETALRTREVAVLGVFDDRSDRIPPTVHGVPVLGDTRALLTHRILPYIDRIVLTVNAAGPARTAELIERLRVLPNDLCLFLDGEDPKSRSTTLSWLARSTLSVGGVKARESRQMLKRAQDLVVSLLLLVPALPIMALIAVAVRLDSPGPILFRQRRHGFNNEEITVWKFRSMRAETTDQAGARQVALNDDRVTRIGRFIRATSLDELPQLFNVLTGQMSLVGPRPHPIGMKTAGEDSARLVAEYAWRHRMKPGITGWAQIHGSRGPVHTAEEVRRRVELDVDYIERQSFWLDLYIILMTLPRLLGDSEAVR
jgi:polysaccharide biosynthesis protein PslA